MSVNGCVMEMVSSPRLSIHGSRDLAKHNLKARARRRCATRRHAEPRRVTQRNAATTALSDTPLPTDNSGSAGERRVRRTPSPATPRPARHPRVVVASRWQSQSAADSPAGQVACAASSPPLAASALQSPHSWTGSAGWLLPSHIPGPTDRTVIILLGF